MRNPTALTLVAPDSGVLPAANLKSLDDWRAFVHQAVPVVVALLVTVDIVGGDLAGAAVPFLFALADNVLSVGNTGDRIRRAIYAGVGVLQTGGLLTVLLADRPPQYMLIASAVLAVASAFLARFYTPTSTMLPLRES